MFVLYNVLTFHIEHRNSFKLNITYNLNLIHNINHLDYQKG